MNNKKLLEVYINQKHVGTLAETKDHLMAFEYSDEWVRFGFSISPASIPLQKGVFVPKKYDPFDGLFGVFADSLPDGWGRLLVDRLLLKRQINPASISALTRLAIVGNSGMGALEYRPSNEMNAEMTGMTLDELAKECEKMFDTEHSEHLDELFRLGGSSGGARPKVNYEISGEEWIVKFPSSIDRKNIGREEYDYSVCAKKCQLPMTETRLLPSKICEGYFATKRFDRDNGQKIHMVSVSGLLETSHRIPNLDYNILMQLTLKIAQSYEEVEKLFRWMCFNVFAHNRDDHSKNFSYIYKDESWKLSPAYDLTYSNSIGGEHATTINGNGSNPGIADIMEVAKKTKMDEKKALRIAEEIREVVAEDLKEYL
ncbi:MAG: type II toxin-antitoxin system HipA family toxin [Candidatus Pacebacteria bacterium]|nr:type II toxin-antitoxin system HipA family toxin [Candidatus Paceibacterota bacterium]